LYYFRNMAPTPKAKNIYARQAAWRKRNPWARSVEFARRRCTDEKHKDYLFYGGRGLAVELTSEEAGRLWARDAASTMRAPSLDRVDSDKNYTFDNCRYIEKSINERLPHLSVEQLAALAIAVDAGAIYI